MDFNTLVHATHKARKTEHPVSDDTITLCFDPGHTTGFAVFHGTELFECGQLTTKPIEQAVLEIQRVIDFYEPDIVVVEDYRVYSWKTEHHAGSELLTTRIIGVIETFCVIRFIPHIIKQPAHVAKGFCTNTKLKSWGMYTPAKKHAMDAVRHGCYYILFGTIDRKQSTSHTVG